PYRPNCFPGDNTCGGCNCSEPHEPYLNIRYSGATSGITAGWDAPGGTGQPKHTTGNGGRTDPAVVCTPTSSPLDCTSNAYDLDGGLVSLSPVTDGVFYCEGDFSSKGNANYYGSVLVGGTVDSKGTPDL